MNSSTKVFSILSLSAAIGSILSKTKDDNYSENKLDMIRWRGKKLSEAGFIATKSYPFTPLTDSKVKQIEKKVDQICEHDSSFEIVETLSFLLCGLDEIVKKTNSKNYKFIKSVICRALWCLEFFDSKLDNDDIYDKAICKYYEWVV